MDRIELEKLVRIITEEVLAAIVEKSAPNLIRAIPTPQMVQTKPSISTSAAAPQKPTGESLVFNKKLLTERDILDMAASKKSSVLLKQNTIITPLARERAQDKGIKLVYSGEAVFKAGGSSQNVESNQLGFLAGRCSQSEINMVISAAKTAGFSIKPVKADGVTTGAVAEAASECAKLVSDGVCARGIIVDENAFSLAIQANKVPNVRAVVCWDIASTVKSRNECDANILLINNRLLGLMMIKKIVAAWLGK